MERHEIVMQQFQALRLEINAIKLRLFITVLLAIVGVPLMGYLAEKPATSFLGPILPFVILVLSMIYVAEEHALMRAGRYIRERVEPLIEEGAGWEAWLEANPGSRTMDKSIFWCVVITCFVFYFASVGLALTKLPLAADEILGGEYQVWLGAAIYALGGLWLAITVHFYWRALR